MGGWIKLYRQLLESNIFKNEKLLKVFIWCLLKATHSEHEQQVGRQKVSLQPGQFVYGRKKAAEELSMKETTIRDYMNLLKDQQSICVKSTNKFSVVTVVNWELYQMEETKTANNSDNKWTTNGQQMDTNNNEKNEKNDKNKDIFSEIKNFRSRYDESILSIIDRYFEILRTTRVSGKVSNSIIHQVYAEMDKHPVIVVQYACKTVIDNPQHHSKKENYLFGIMRNTKSDEAQSKLTLVVKKAVNDWRNF